MGPPDQGVCVMTQYLLSVHGADSEFDPEAGKFGAYPSMEAAEQAFADTDVFNQRIKDEGYFVFAGGLASASTASVVDGTGPSPVITDGPYLETKEWIGGLRILRSSLLRAALKL